MRRIKLFLAAVAVMAAMLAAVPGPAMADVDFDDGEFFFDDGGFFFGDDFFDFGGGGVTLDVSNEAESGGVSLGFSVD